MNSSNQSKAITTELAHAGDVTHWRCRRMSTSSGRGTSLAWGGTREWSIDTLSPDAIYDRWGSGSYVIAFVRVNADGSREPRGRSERITLDGPPLPTAETFADPIAYALYVIRRVEHDRAALARRSLERERMQHMLDLERFRLNLAHILEAERLAAKVAMARIEARSRVRQIEIKLADLLVPTAPQVRGPSSKPN